MNKLKKFKIKRKFNGVVDLYTYILENGDEIENLSGIKIQEHIDSAMYCLVGKEKITERNILFFASENDYAESLGELIVLASSFDTDIIMFFMENITKMHSSPFKWLQKICNDDTQIVLVDVAF